MKTKIEDIMVTDVKTITPNQSIREACIFMAQLKIGATVVVDGSQLLGMFSERDLLNRVAAQNIDLDKTPVEKVMTSPVITINAGTTANDALYIMTVEHIRHLPVVNDDGKLQGMVGIRDLLQTVLNETIDEFITKKAQN